MRSSRNSAHNSCSRCQHASTPIHDECSTWEEERHHVVEKLVRVGICALWVLLMVNFLPRHPTSAVIAAVLHGGEQAIVLFHQQVWLAFFEQKGLSPYRVSSDLHLRLLGILHDVDGRIPDSRTKVSAFADGASDPHASTQRRKSGSFCIQQFGVRGFRSKVCGRTCCRRNDILGPQRSQTQSTTLRGHACG